MDYLPSDTRREILSHNNELDMPNIRSVSKQWSRFKVRCTEEYIERVSRLPVTRNEITRSGTASKFIVIRGDEDVSLFLLMGNRSPVVIVYGYDANYELVLDVDERRMQTLQAVLTVVFSHVTRGGMYWVDPYTTRDVINRRLIGCELDSQPPLRDLFPAIVPYRGTVVLTSSNCIL